MDFLSTFLTILSVVVLYYIIIAITLPFINKFSTRVIIFIWTKMKWTSDPKKLKKSLEAGSAKTWKFFLW